MAVPLPSDILSTTERRLGQRRPDPGETDTHCFSHLPCYATYGVTMTTDPGGGGFAREGGKGWGTEVGQRKRLTVTHHSTEFQVYSTLALEENAL